MNRLAITTLMMLCGVTAYAGELEAQRAMGGLRFGESAISGDSPAVHINNDLRPAPKISLTADLTKNAPLVPAAVPTAAKELDDIKPGARLGKKIGQFTGAIAFGIGGLLLGMGIASALAVIMPGAAAAIAIIGLVGASVLSIIGINVGAHVGGIIGAFAGAVIGALKRR